jgi:enoyl-CoA hydratase/carnithine racemase
VTDPVSSPRVLARQDGGVLYLTLNREDKRNALSLALLDDLAGILAENEQDETIRCVVLTGSGERSFAAGGDLVELNKVRTPEQARNMGHRARSALDRIRYFPVPVVAALNGYALGGGAELALACDMRVAAPHAEIGFIQASLNVTTAWGAAADLAASLGPQRMLRLLIEGRRLDADAALQLGLIDSISPAGHTLAEATADFIAPILSRGSTAVRSLKAVASAGRANWHRRLDQVEEDSMVSAWVHDDHWSAVRQILGKD